MMRKTRDAAGAPQPRQKAYGTQAASSAAMLEPNPVAPGFNRLDQTQRDAHPHCFVCSGSNPMGLALRCQLQPDGSVRGTFMGNCALEGYPGLLHGGLIAALLDGAMTNCLFSHGIRAVTAELQVRYLAPVCSAEPLNVRAWLESSRHALFQLRGELIQGGETKVRASSKFMSGAGNSPQPDADRKQGALSQKPGSDLKT